MALALREEGKKVNSDINVTPMVDVMLVLLIIFMVITPMLQKGVSVDMARVNSPTPMPDADKEDSLLVAVMRDGQIFFGTDKVTADQLTSKVKDRLAELQNAQKAARQMYDAACMRLGIPNDLEEAEAQG